MRIVSTTVATVLALLGSCAGALALEPGAPLASYVLRQWTDAEGLPQSSVLDLVQTRDGTLWLATAEGLARFDGERFTVFDTSNTPAIRNNLTRTLHEARDGSLWIGTFGGGVVHLKDGAWTAYTTDNGLCHDDVRDLDEDAHGTLWIATAECLNTIDASGAVRALAVADGLPTHDLATVLAARDGSVWVGTVLRGLARYRDGRFTLYTTRDGLPHDDVLRLYEDDRGELWVGTRGGLARRHAGGFTTYTTGKGLRSNVVSAITRDRQGMLWAGTLGGILHRLEHDRFVAHTSVFGTGVSTLLEDHEGSLWIGGRNSGLSRLSDPLIRTLGAAEGLAHEVVWTVHEDAAGRMWIGTAGGLHVLEPGAPRARPIGPPLPRGEAIVVYEDRAERLWVGTQAGLHVREDGRWRLYTSRDGIVGRPVRVLLEDREGRLWIGTNSGLTMFSGGTFTSFANANPLLSGEVAAFLESRDGTLWVGTRNGIAMRRPDGTWRSIGPEEGLSHYRVLSLHEDADDTMWVGTHGGGLNRIRDGHIAVIRARDGLCDDVVFAIFEDETGDIWTSSNRGICRVARSDLDTFADGRLPRVRATAYGVGDGMRSRECNGPAGWQARDGRLWFPTIRGVAIVDPRRLNRVPPIVSVQAVDTGDGWVDARSGLEILPESREVQIRYAAASYRVPEKVRFRYRLEGRDRQWTDAGSRREVTYAGLPPGDYVFHLVAANNDGVWDEKGATFAFHVVPRFHETMAFRAGVGVVLVALALAAHRVRAWRLMRRLAHLEKIVETRTAEVRAQQKATEDALATVSRQRSEIEALSEARKRFFANVSHELRTPLTLLIGPLHDQVEGAPTSKALAAAMLRNARRLARLVEQLLDLERIDAGRFPLQPATVELARVSQETATAFMPLADAEGVGLEVVIDGVRAPVHADPDQIGRVVENLLSNALKFTPQGGRVRVTVAACDDSDGAGGMAQVVVEDTGPGVPPEWRERIFDRFAQMGGPATRAREGAGLGLALCREIVALHGGELFVEPVDGTGSRFVLRLPCVAATEPGVDTDAIDAARPMSAAEGATPGEPVAGRSTPPSFQASKPPELQAFPRPELAQDGLASEDGQASRPPGLHASQRDRPRVLVAEDQPDLRRYIEGVLSAEYEVETVEDGEAALGAVWREPPDVIVSDIVMPRRDGFEVVRALRAESRFAGIPIIFLTARAGDADEIEALAIGADQYLRKPFQREVLRAHVAAALRACRRLRDQFASAPGTSGAPSRAGSFPERVRAWVESHAHEEALSVDDLASAFNMSRATLRRRLVAAASLAPSDFVRHVRLARARRLLQEGAGNVSEVAYAVGFNSLSAFSRAYRATHGEPPSSSRPPARS